MRGYCQPEYTVVCVNNSNNNQSAQLIVSGIERYQDDIGKSVAADNPDSSYRRYSYGVPKRRGPSIRDAPSRTVARGITPEFF